MAQHKEHLKDLVPEDCVAIHEIIDYAEELSEREKKEGWEKFEDANRCRTPLSRQLSSIVTGKLEKGCSWYDFAPDSAWVSEGKIDDVSLRIFRAAELYSRSINPGKGMHYHDAFACLVTACTTDPQIHEKVEIVRRKALETGLLDANRQGFHEYSIQTMDELKKTVEA